MDDWQKDLLQAWEAMTAEIGQFFAEVTEALEIITDEVNSAVVAELDRQLQEFFNPIIEQYLDIEATDIEVEHSLNYTYPVEPTAEKCPACRGCRHYHGQVYGGNLFVCGMHPYGWDDDNCPDWEQAIIDDSDASDWN